MIPNVMSQDMERGEKSTPSHLIGPKMGLDGKAKWEVGSGKWELSKGRLF